MKTVLFLSMVFICSATGVHHAFASGHSASCAKYGRSYDERPFADSQITTSMELVEICIYNSHDTTAGPQLRVTVPAAYVQSKTMDKDGYPGSVWIEFWLPDFRPTSAIPELNPRSDSVIRKQYLRDNAKNRIWIAITGTTYELRKDPKIETGIYVPTRVSDRNERVLPDKFGLMHYGRRCESIEELRKAGRDISTRKCSEGRSYADVYYGYSDLSKGTLKIRCTRDVGVCEATSQFRGYMTSFKLPTSELFRWKEYETFANEFLNKHVVVIDDKRSEN